MNIFKNKGISYLLIVPFLFTSCSHEEASSTESSSEISSESSSLFSSEVESSEETIDRTLKFKNGSFKILQINDFQDDDNPNEYSVSFLNNILDRYTPDLVVIVGDQLSFGDHLSKTQIELALSYQLQPLEDRNIPFLYTFGNHDYDHIPTMSLKQQKEIYDSYSMCYASYNGTDIGTYNNLIYKRDGITPVLNIYMMDTHRWSGDYTNAGINEEQLNWYCSTSDSLKELNGGEVLPSLLFQHIPIKET